MDRTRVAGAARTRPGKPETFPLIWSTATAGCGALGAFCERVRSDRFVGRVLQAVSMRCDSLRPASTQVRPGPPQVAGPVLGQHPRLPHWRGEWLPSPARPPFASAVQLRFVNIAPRERRTSAHRFRCCEISRTSCFMSPGFRVWIRFDSCVGIECLEVTACSNWALRPIPSLRLLEQFAGDYGWVSLLSPSLCDTVVIKLP